MNKVCVWCRVYCEQITRKRGVCEAYAEYAAIESRRTYSHFMHMKQKAQTNVPISCACTQLVDTTNLFANICLFLIHKCIFFLFLFTFSLIIIYFLQISILIKCGRPNVVVDNDYTVR